MSTAKKFAGQTAVYGISTIASRVLTFFLTPLYTRSFPTAAYGIITTLYSYISMTNAVVSFGMETTFFRYINRHADNKQKAYNNAFASVLGLTIIFLLLVLPFGGYIASFIDISHAHKLAGKGIQASSVIGMAHADYIKYVNICIAIIIIDAWCAIPFAKIRSEGKPGRYGFIKLASVLSFIIFNLIFIKGIPFWLERQLPGSEWITQWYTYRWVGYIFISELLSSIITLLLLLPELLKIRLNIDRELLWQMYSYSWPVMIANLSYLVNENMDKILLGKLLPGDNAIDVGTYGACGKISIFLSIFVNAFRLGAEPFFFNNAKNKNAGQTYARIMDYFVITICVIFIALVANIDLLRYWVSGRNPAETAMYWKGLKVIPPLIFGYVSLGIYMNLSVWYKLSDQTRYGLYISGIGAILTVVLNVIFIPQFSYMASAWISLSAYATMMVLSYIWGQKNYPIPYNIKKNLAYIISSIIVVYLSFYVFNSPASYEGQKIGWSSIGIGNALLLIYVSVAFYFERDNLRAIFKR